MEEPQLEKHHIPDLKHEDSLASYLHKIKKFPLLTQEEEYTAAKTWHKTGDRKAMEQIINAHLRLLPKIAAGYKGYGLPFHDLIAEGHIGLMQAMRGFHPDKGARFSTYAQWWVKASMMDYILRSWSLVKTGTTAAQKKLFFNLRSIKDKLVSSQDHALSSEQVKEIAKELKVPVEEVKEMEKRLANPDYSLNTTIGTGEDLEWQDWIPDEEADHEEKFAHNDEFQKRMQMVAKAMGDLSQNELAVFKSRRLDEPPKTLEEIGLEMNLSRERVRQIEMKAFTKVQKNVRNQARMHENFH
jgi:RNA polymerase sigma-32 factor